MIKLLKIYHLKILNLLIYIYIHLCLYVGTCTYVHVSVEAKGPDPSTAGGTCCCELPDIGPGN